MSAPNSDVPLGGVFRISRVADGYVGAFCKVNFLDILPKEKLDMFTDQNGEPTFNGTLASNILETYKNTRDEYSKIRTKWDQVQVGLKLGVHIKCCANPVEKTKRQIQKEMLDEMKRMKNDPIIIKQDPQYIYIVPQCDLLDKDDEEYVRRQINKVKERE